MGIVLPMEKVKALATSPENLIIYSKPKTGKTELGAALENSLILDFEKGTNFIDARKLQVNTIEDLIEIGKAIKEANYPYKYIIVDTVTAMEDKLMGLAETLYSQTPGGKYWFNPKPGEAQSGKQKYKKIIFLPDGAGYQFTRMAFEDTSNFIKTLAPRIIWMGHVKDTLLEKSGVMVSTNELDLLGKTKRQMTSYSDSIGYMFRKGNQNILSFKTTDDVACGSRAPHLRNQEIVVSEIIDGKIVTHWDKIYID